MAVSIFESSLVLNQTLVTFLARAGCAIACGAAVGYERERRGKPAGFRTNTLICLGAAIYMGIGEVIQFGHSGVDPTRIAAQVVSGIGFLGGGTIIQARGTVTGLTSAATIWVVAGVGIIIGAGFPLLGVASTLLILLTLVVLGRIEPKILGKCHWMRCEITFGADGGRGRVEAASILSEHDVPLTSLGTTKNPDGTSVLSFPCCTRHPSHHRFVTELSRGASVIDIKFEDPAGKTAEKQ